MKENIQGIMMIFTLAIFSLPIYAQAPETGTYGNEWLEGKYGQPWLKVEVEQKGIYKITLPAEFQNKPNKLHLYRRGVEVAVLSATNTELESYGVPNDGASDALLYRPYTGVRANPYFSWFSDRGYYFLTVSETASSTKLAAHETPINLTGAPVPYHWQQDVFPFTLEDTYSAKFNLNTNPYTPSYLKEGKGRSGQLVYDCTCPLLPGYKPTFDFNIKLDNVYVSSAVNGEIEILFNGRSTMANKIAASIGKSTSIMAAIADTVGFSSFTVTRKQYPLNVSTHADSAGNSFFQLKSLVKGGSLQNTAGFSVTYLKLRYPQTFDMNGKALKQFILPAGSTSSSNVHISNVPTGAIAINITDSENPKIVPVIVSGTGLDAMVPREFGKELTLMVTNSRLTPIVSSTSFLHLAPSDYEYLIVASPNLLSSSGAIAQYRASTIGGGFKTLNLQTDDVYNLFNYGEPSPLATRRFVNYMLSEGISPKHNLLLVGTSYGYTNIADTSSVNGVPAYNTGYSLTDKSVGTLKSFKELPNSVSTLGEPGNDNLLAAGEGDTPDMLPAIRVGRIPADSSRQVLDYLSKVVEYEQDTSGLAWRKKVLHLSDGANNYEKSSFAAELNDIGNRITSAPFSGSIIAKQRVIPGKDTVSVNVANEINEGVGVVSYLGHGFSRYTVFNFGYASDPSRGYSNKGKYPINIYAACGVGAVFNDHPEPHLASDWLLTANKGAIAVLGISTYGWQWIEHAFMPILYDSLFTNNTVANSGTIGNRLLGVYQKLYDGNNSNAELITNAIHQRILIGDPALRLLRVDESCKSSNYIASAMTSGQNETKQAENLIVASNVIPENASAKYHAGREVKLANNFVVKAGAVFHGYIEPCSSGDESDARKAAEIIQEILAESESEEIVVYPNPTVASANIRLLETFGEAAVEVIESGGARLLNGTIKNGRGVIDLSNYSSGTYLIRVILGDKVLTKKIIKF